MSSLDATTGRSKRLKTSPFPIEDLPTALLADVASYVPKLSWVMLAVAITAPSSSWTNSKKGQPSARGKLILSVSDSVKPAQPQEEEEGGWDPRDPEARDLDEDGYKTLDFATLEKSLTSRLSDDDMHAILVCVNAKEKLKRLKLAGCVSITGRGLGPLCNSTVLKQIDLSLVGVHEELEIEPPPRIAEREVLPILNSIVDADGNSLKHVHVPNVWRLGERSETDSRMLDQFLESYDELLDSRNYACYNCRTDLGGFVCPGHEQEDKEYFGLQYYTCCICLQHGHYDCGRGECSVNACEYCIRDFCAYCMPFFKCKECDIDICIKCSGVDDVDPPDDVERFYECRECHETISRY